MKYILLASTLLLAIGCDAPQRARNPINYVNGSTLGNASGTGAFTNNPTAPVGSTTGPTTPGTTPGTPTTPGFETCDLDGRNKFYVPDIGYFGICQSTSDETSFLFKPTLSSQTRICLIPTYKEANGSSTYLGQPQCTTTTSNQVINGKLYKDRVNYASYPIKGVIVMREALITEYYGCMNGYVNWPANVCQSNPYATYCQFWPKNCPYGSKTSVACDTEARNYMNQVCSTFKSKYANAYADITLKQ